MIAVAVAVLGVLPGVRALALPLDDDDTNRKDAECFIDKEDILSPGLSLSPSSGALATPRPGIIECHGKINGAAPTGDGQVTEAARYGTKDPDTCQSGGEGEGIMSMTIPTSDGQVKIDDKQTYTYGAFKAGAAFSGAFQGEHMSGTFEVQPVDGDCASKPVTKFHVKGQGTLK